MKRITERKAKETIDRYLEGSLSMTDSRNFHIYQPYLFEYIYLTQDRLEGKEREILRTLATMIYCVMNEFAEVPLVTRSMIADAINAREARNVEKSSDEATDDMPGVFPQYSLYSSFSTFIFSLFLTKKAPSFSEKEKTLIGVLLNEIIMLIFLYDEHYPHRKLSREFIKQPDEDFGRVAEIGRIIIQPLFDQFSRSGQFMKLTPDVKNASLMILSHYTGLMRFLHETEPQGWEADHLGIFLTQQKTELDNEIFELEKEILLAFFDFFYVFTPQNAKSNYKQRN